MTQDRIAMIGAGVVARALAVSLEKAGVTIDSIGVRNEDKATKALQPHNLQGKITSILEAAENADVILIAVSDDAIQTVTEYLYQHHAVKKKTILVHFSGSLSSLILKHPSADARVASAHPLQTFPNVDAALGKLKNTHWFCEGEADALKWIRSLIETLGNRFVEIDTEHKAFYHIGAVFSCNYLTTLIAAAQKCHRQAGIAGEQSLSALKPLVEATVNNIFELGTTQSLTGPIARGDVNTVADHLQSLSGFDSKTLALYKTLGLATLAISREKGVASSEKLSQLEQLLN